MLNKKKLNKFADEMLKEVKDLKDLTKQKLPEVAKEYIEFEKVTNTGFLILFFSLTMFLGLGAYYLELESKSDTQFAAILLGVGSLICFGLTIGFLYSLLSVIYQPKRTAIYAITSLFKD